MAALCSCGHGYTFSFAEGRVYCRACEGDSIVTERDLAFILRERKRRAHPGCEECSGLGTINYTSGCGDGEDDAPCVCIDRAGDVREVPDPMADEGQSDARELARDRF